VIHKSAPAARQPEEKKLEMRLQTDLTLKTTGARSLVSHPQLRIWSIDSIARLWQVEGRAGLQNEAIIYIKTN